MRMRLAAWVAMGLAAAWAPEGAFGAGAVSNVWAGPLPALTAAADGTVCTNASLWQARRRPELLELFRTHVYGRVPGTPYTKASRVVDRDEGAMDGTAIRKQVEVVLATGRTSVTIRVVLFIPRAAPKPVPVFLLICNRGAENIDPTRRQKSPFWPAEALVARGYGTAAFLNSDAMPDRPDGFRTGAPAMLDAAPRPPDAWGALAVWAWGASRVLDYLVTDPDVARDRVAVIGHSRGGKTALWAGAEDERFALAISNDSGCGGAALSRHRAAGRETVAAIAAKFPFWFCANFPAYGGREDSLPVDQHQLLALIAPRAVAVGSASEDRWADPPAEFLALVEAAPAFRLFGRAALGAQPRFPAVGEALHGDGAHYHLRPGKHDLTPADWQAYMDFADRALKP